MLRWLFLRKLFNIFSFLMLVLCTLSAGIEGLFQVKILGALMGTHLSRALYYSFAFFGLYGVHLFIEYAKLILNPSKESEDLYYEISDQGAQKDEANG